MNVMDTARTIGLVAPNGEVTGTIDQQKVLRALADLEQADPADADLFHAAADLVRHARSAGVAVPEPNGFHGRPTDGAVTQLRYRSEMADLFTDLAIDVGLRNHRNLVVTA